MCTEFWSVGLGQEGVAWGWGNCPKYFKRGWNEKEGRRKKDFEKGRQPGSRGNGLTNYEQFQAFRWLFYIVLRLIDLVHVCIIVEFFRSSRRRCSMKKIVRKNSAKFTVKHLQLIKKETLAQVFSSKFCEIFRGTFFYRTPSGESFWCWQNLCPELSEITQIIKR